MGCKQRSIVIGNLVAMAKDFAVSLLQMGDVKNEDHGCVAVLTWSKTFPSTDVLQTNMRSV
jgi:hypothetical protein